MKNETHQTITSINCFSCPLRKLKCFTEFEDDHIKQIKNFKVGELHIEKGSTLMLEGSNVMYLYTILHGWCFRSKTLEDGRRQILNFALPGDFLGLQSSLLGEVQHSVEAISDVRLCLFEKDRLWELYRDQPELGFSMTWMAAKEERFLDENLLSVGRRSALERVSYLLVNLYMRAKALSLNDGREIEFPLTQDHVADALGLTPQHTNKMIRELVKRGLVSWAEKKLNVVDLESLAQIAQYEIKELPKRPLI